MKLISHRGNINGPNPEKENDPLYIDEAINKGFDVEIDIWVVDNNLYLGHDKPQYIIDIEWIRYRISELWIHCKNIDALLYFQNHEEVGKYCHYFWHQNDDITLTSFNIIWAFPGKQPIMNSIAVMPELFNDDLTKSSGICSDFVNNHKI